MRSRPRGERQARVRPDQEHRLVGTARARLPLAQLDAELAVSHPHALAAPRQPLPRTVPPPRCARRAASPAIFRTRASAAFDRLLGGRDRIDALVERHELGARFRGAGEQLLQRGAPEAPPRIGDPLELRLDLLPTCPGRPRDAERKERSALAASRSRSSASRSSSAAFWSSGASRSTGESARSASAVSPAAPSPSSGSSASAAAAVPSTQLGQMPQTLALLTERVLQARLQPVRVLHERAQLGQPRLAGGRIAGQLLETPTGSTELTPGQPCLRPPTQLLFAAEGVEDGELVGRPGKPALLELARHRQQPLAERRHVLAGGAAPPGIRARPPLSGPIRGRGRRLPRRPVAARGSGANASSSSSPSGRSNSAST